MSLTLRSAGTVRPVRMPLTAAALVVGAVGLDLAFDPVARHVPLCPFHAVTGWWCPLCGGLRSAYSLAHGRVAVAAHDNLLFLIALPLLAGYWIDWLVRARSGRPRRRLSGALVWTVVGLAVAFTVIRNLPGLAALRPPG